MPKQISTAFYRSAMLYLARISRIRYYAPLGINNLKMPIWIYKYVKSKIVLNHSYIVSTELV